MDTAERNPASAHLFIVNPLSGARMDNLFSTHPKAENRIAELKKQAAAMDRFAQLADERKWGPPVVGRSKTP